MTQINNISHIEKCFCTMIKSCCESFVDENTLDEIDINILENFTDYVIERMEILFDTMKQKH